MAESSAASICPETPVAVSQSAPVDEVVLPEMKIMKKGGNTRMLFLHNELLKSREISKSEWVYLLSSALGTAFCIPADNDSKKMLEPKSRDVVVVIAFELFLVSLPNEWFCSQTESNRACLELFKRAVPQLKSSTLLELLDREWDIVSNHIQSRSKQPNVISILYSSISTAIYSLCVQGNVAWRTKADLMEEISRLKGVNVSISDIAVGKYYRFIQKTLSQKIMTTLMNQLLDAIGNDAICSHKLLELAKTKGMTNFYLIRKVMSAVPHFPWPVMFAKVPEDLKRYEDACEIIGDKVYYGYEQDLGPVATKNYPDLAYVCRKLSIDYLNNKNLQTYVTKTPIRYKDIWDMKIAKFIAENPKPIPLASRLQTFDRRRRTVDERQLLRANTQRYHRDGVASGSGLGSGRKQSASPRPADFSYDEEDYFLSDGYLERDLSVYRDLDTSWYDEEDYFLSDGYLERDLSVYGDLDPSW